MLMCCNYCSRWSRSASPRVHHGKPTDTNSHQVVDSSHNCLVGSPSDQTLDTSRLVSSLLLAPAVAPAVAATAVVPAVAPAVAASAVAPAGAPAVDP